VDLEHRVQPDVLLIFEARCKTTNAPANRGVCTTSFVRSGSDSAL
jgi:hypothetical protein